MITKKAIKIAVVSLFLFFVIFSLRTTLAQDFGISEVDSSLQNNLGKANTDPRSVAANIINVALGFLGIIAVGLILYAGVLWMTSGGEEDKISRAKDILKAAVIGLVIILSAWAIATFVISKLGGAISGGNNNSGNNYCSDGQSRSCGCGGLMTCTDSRWGDCVGSNPDDCVNPPANCDSSALPGCQALNQICADGDFCDDKCACRPQASYGEPCDGNTSNNTCDADNSRCSKYSTCDTNTCLCVGAPVISDLTPVGGFCVNDLNRACLNNDDCGSSGICDMESPNGANKNLVTIFGYNFGEYDANKSGVFFAAANGEVLAGSPKDVNPACIDSWRNDQIIISVPQGAVSGPVKVTNSEGLSDLSNDSSGPTLPDFIVNEIARPGLCSLSPVAGTLNNKVDYQGINLYTGEAYFGNYQSNVGGLYSDFTDVRGLSGQAMVPNIKSGKSGSFVERDLAGIIQKSNYLRFVKDPEEADGPYITSFSPDKGRAGQYLTIRGAGFGGARGDSRVYFVSGNNKVEASYSFPSICAQSVWSDKQAIVKVPDSISDGGYYLEIILGEKTISSQSARPNIFSVDSSLPLAPSLCKISPERGPIGTPVSFWGEYFGTPKSSILGKFNYEKNSSGEIVKEDKTDKAIINVPAEAVSGPVVLAKDSKFSNEFNFLVAECLSNEDCSGQVCCPQTTYKKGHCVDDLESCFIDMPTSVFEWRFSSKYGTLNGADSCLGFAKDFGSCYQGAMCPNSPGACSSPATNYSKIVGSCNITCNGVAGCTAATCYYEPSLDKCILNTTNLVSDCDEGELISPSKNTDLNDEKNIPRIMYWGGKINQHWNLSTGIWESDIDESSGAEIDKLTYCRKFYPSTVRVEEYQNEFSDTWHAGNSRDYYSSIKMSYRCVLSQDEKGISLVGVKKTCGASGQWEIKLSSSCPQGWTRGVGNVCIQNDVSCNSCPNNLSCQKVDKFNSCVSEKLCKGEANCVANAAGENDNCVLEVEPGCDCCCRIGFSEQDCCAPLTCAGTCGSDLTAKPSTNTYGYCSGCAAVGSTPEEKDAACNCTGASGKFCSISDDTPQGICVDCAGLKTQEECGDHPSTCCFDSRRTASTVDDVCRGIGDSQVLSKDKESPDYGYCGYFNCSQANPLICSGLPVKIGKYKKLIDCEQACPKEGGDACNSFNGDGDACIAEPGCCYNYEPGKDGVRKCISGDQIEDSGFCAYYSCYEASEGDPYECNLNPKTIGKFKEVATCSAFCSNPPSGSGLSCEAFNSSASGSSAAGDGKCNFNLCSFAGFQCLQTSGAVANTDSYPECGTCCCQPAGDGVADSCVTSETPDLYCQANAGDCTGANRGLCCGCSKDSDCGSVTTTGCGASSCCESRPLVAETIPAPSSGNVCRNAAIKISFNQKMDATSLIDNFLLFEERSYAQGACPEGTFISFGEGAPGNHLASKNIIINILNNIKYRLAVLLNNKSVLATPPNPDKLYCSVDGSINFVNENNRTSLIFTPKKVLSPATKYFALIKGDENLDSNSGALSAAKIGMNEQGFRDSSDYYVNPVSFNGKLYKNSYAFQFSTLPNQGARNGICEINQIRISPLSYLFQATDNDKNEDDSNVNSPFFDSVRDSDKLFFAEAYNSDKQILTPVSGYNWDWDWSIVNDKVVSFSDRPTELPANQKLVEANLGVTDDKTQVNVAINMEPYRSNCGENCNAFFFGDKISATSDVYVFSCANPWPAVSPNGTWSPWEDSKNNCVGDSQGCDSFNYKFYYCRDAGEPGTFDDLPVINYSPVSLTGNLVCSSDGNPCESAGDSCGLSGEGAGVCIWEVLKESYFFRDPILSGIEISSLKDTKIGGEAEISWRSVAEGVAAFKVYYLQSGQKNMLSKEFRPTGSGGVCIYENNGKNYSCNTKINGLIDGATYIFKISLISSTKTESAFSQEKLIKTSDQTPPSPIAAPKVVGENDQIKFSWNQGTESGLTYRLYIGTAPGKYGESFDTGPDAKNLLMLKSRFSGDSYYWSVSVFDKARNESPKSLEKNFIVKEDQVWMRTVNKNEPSAKDRCLIKIGLTNDSKIVCDNNPSFTKSAWVSGEFKIEGSMAYCSVSGCDRPVTPNTCGYYSGPWFNTCYIIAK